MCLASLSWIYRISIFSLFSKSWFSKTFIRLSYSSVAFPASFSFRGDIEGCCGSWQESCHLLHGHELLLLRLLWLCSVVQKWTRSHSAAFHFVGRRHFFCRWNSVSFGALKSHCNKSYVFTLFLEILLRARNIGLDHSPRRKFPNRLQKFPDGIKELCVGFDGYKKFQIRIVFKSLLSHITTCNWMQSCCSFNIFVRDFFCQTS